VKKRYVDAGIEYGIGGSMEIVRKITVKVPRELLDKAQRASGAGITQTVRTGLQLVAASQACAQLRQLRGLSERPRSAEIRRALARSRGNRVSLKFLSPF
jgi:hypothetical protein